MPKKIERATTDEVEEEGIESMFNMRRGDPFKEGTD